MHLFNNQVILIVLGEALLLRSVLSQFASYMRYDNYSSPDFDSAPGQFVPTAQDCVVLSTVTPLSNGVVFNNSTLTCKILTANNNEILVRLRLNPGWTTYVKDISAKWSLLFKGESRLYGYYTTSYRFGQSYYGNSDYTQTYSASVASFNKSTSCKCNYRNQFLDYWPGVSQVKLQTYRGDFSTASLTFTSPGGRSDWMNTYYLVSSFPYRTSNIRALSYNYFAISGESGYSCDNYYYRDFQLKYATSCSQFYYSSVSTSAYYELCPHYILATNEISCIYGDGYSPSLYFSYSDTACVPKSYCSGVADFLTVTARVTSRTIFI